MLSFYLKSLLLSLIAGALLGSLVGSVAWGMVLTLLGLLGWNYRQLDRLSSWLSRNTDIEVPEGSGLWGKVFDDIYREQKRHRESQAQLKAILKRVQKSTTALKEGVVMLDAQGNLDWWNSAAKRMLGFKRPQDQRQPIINLIRDPNFIRYFHNRDYSNPLELASPLDQEISLQFTITEFAKNDRLLIVRDVTRIHKLEAMRRDFLGNVSHELKTPLTVVQGYLETFLGQRQMLSAPLEKGMDQMLSQAKRMGNLVNDLLMLSRLETGSQVEEETQIDLHQLLAEIQLDAQELAQRQGKQLEIQLEVEQPGWLMGSEKEILSAFSNLVYNAVRYTPDRGLIQLSWRTNEKGGYFAVKDNGIGIDPSHFSRLTERFYRVDYSRSTASGGTGLGLAIVKHVLLRHNANMDIQSALGKGSTFSCHFPSRTISSDTQSRQIAR